MQNGFDTVDYNGVFHDGFDRPIGEWNCRHFAIPIILGVSKPVHTEKQLDDMEKNSAEKYPAKQKQREYERRLRALKSEYKIYKDTGQQDTDDARNLKKKINALQKQYRIFSREHGVEYEPERARVY